MNPYLYIAPEVADALQNKHPVVALESTLITHGLPYPSNVETATRMEAAVRAQGAIPATVAVLKGKLTVGIGGSEIERLGALPTGSIRKCSRRDLAIAAGLQEDAATTVAGTMIAAHMAGISVFATGGIGGVHRGAPYDVSADLIELGRTPVAVVCGGAKSILDLPLTLEVLETQGVPVIGYQTTTLPAFYTRSSGLPVDADVDTPEAAARIIKAAQDLGMEHGIIFGVPVPQQDELSAAVAEAAIQQATAEAAQQGIHGKAVTPFVLGRVLELTGGESKRANVSLLVNNAAVGGAIASALSRLG
jgi:pseudouridylate synthase